MSRRNDGHGPVSAATQADSSLSGFFGSRLIALAVGLVLLAAAALKGHQLATAPRVPSTVLTSQCLMLAVVALELLLGLWMVSGSWARQARSVALVCFTAFLAMSLYRASVGESSCGCFGKVPVSPWVSAGIDLLAVMALALWRPGVRRQDQSAPGWLRITGVAVAGLAVGVLAGVAARLPEPARLAEDGGVLGDGRRVALEPEQWVGKRFPLLRHIDVAAELSRGHWLVVLYRRDCRICAEEIPRYEQLVRNPEGAVDTPRVALIEVPHPDTPGQDTSVGLSPCLRGCLSRDWEWIVKTPTVLWVTGGRVSRLEGTRGAEPSWRRASRESGVGDD